MIRANRFVGVLILLVSPISLHAGELAWVGKPVLIKTESLRLFPQAQELPPKDPASSKLPISPA